jgi:hypothetical protein
MRPHPLEQLAYYVVVILMSFMALDLWTGVYTSRLASLWGAVATLLALFLWALPALPRVSIAVRRWLLLLSAALACAYVTFRYLQ